MKSYIGYPEARPHPDPLPRERVDPRCVWVYYGARLRNQRDPEGDADEVQRLIEPDRNIARVGRLLAFFEGAHPPLHGGTGIDEQVDKPEHQTSLPAQRKAEAGGVDGSVNPGGGMAQAAFV